MNLPVRALLIFAAIVAHGTVRAQERPATDWPRFHVGVAAGRVKSEGLHVSMADVGGIAAQLGTDATVDGTGGTGRKAVLGFRPLRVVGMEIQYLDFGHGPSIDRFKVGGRVPLQVLTVQGSTDARVASALLFIPERAILADVYAKVGIARVHESFDLYGYTALLPGCVPAIPNCEIASGLQKADSSPYVGLGARFKIPRVPAGIRVEYESIDRDGGDPVTLLSLGIAAEF